MLSNQIKEKAIQVADAGAFMILFLLTVVAVIATWLIPAGAYSKLSYEPASQELKSSIHIIMLKSPRNSKELDKMGVKLKLNNLNLARLINLFQFQIRMSV